MASYLKKAQLLKMLNLSAKSFEQKLQEGVLPQPALWLGAEVRSRRWDPATISERLGIPPERLSVLLK